MDDDAEMIRRERDAAQSTIDELTEAQRRLIEIEAAQLHDQRHVVAHHQPPIPDHDARLAVASGDHEPEEEDNDDAAAQLGYQLENDDDGVWSGHLRRAIATGRFYVPRIHAGGAHFVACDDDLYPLLDEEEELDEYPSDDHGGHMLSDPALYHDGGGFGGVPASAAAIAGLKKQRYDDGSVLAADGGEMCVICMREYSKGKRLYVMPCEYRHRFHRKCLRKWLSRSHLCPLCRHALPTEED